MVIVNRLLPPRPPSTTYTLASIAGCCRPFASLQADQMEADFAGRLTALDAKFAALLEAQTQKRANEMAQLQKEQEENARATAAKIQDAVDAVQFGVVPPPGSDIAAAVKAMAAEGGKVFLKRGVHEISETIVVDKAITFVGEGGCTCAN